MLTATTVGRYELLGELGRGAMGVVYRAKDPLIGRTVALKTIRLSEEGTGLTHAELVNRFQNETRAAGLLTHPNIVIIYDAGESDGLCYIAFEFVNGKSLRFLLDSGEKFTIPRLLKIMDQVCPALEYAHQNNVVHRDIKPANIMLTDGGVVKIADFGAAKIMQYRVARESDTMGTPGYMSPEQIKGSFIDRRTDIFSLGVTLYEMTTGKRPFSGKDVPSTLHSIVHHEPPSPHDLNPSLPLGFSSTIMKALSKSPHLRYDCCSDFLEDLTNYRPGRSAPSPSAALAAKRLAARLAAAEFGEMPSGAQMPEITRVAPSPAAGMLPKAADKPAPPPAAATASTFRAESPEEPVGEIPGVYAGPPSKYNLVAFKRYARFGAGMVVALWLFSFALKNFGHDSRSNSDTVSAPQQVPSPPPPASAAAAPVPAPLFVSASKPRVATLGDLQEPWASKSFLFYSVTQSRNVLALLIRLPGPASESSTYWAFSLEAPFNQCELQYVLDVRRLSSEYGLSASHPMVVNPCSHSVFDPLQFQNTGGNTLVRGAVVKGSDVRPPYAIEVRVSSNQVLATAME